MMGAHGVDLCKKEVQHLLGSCEPRIKNFKYGPYVWPKLFLCSCFCFSPPPILHAAPIQMALPCSAFDGFKGGEGRSVRGIAEVQSGAGSWS